ncbi:DUF4157 domain-containing protein [Pseudenhygromyxa sp. WMMC2535]|uniref:eCIS core domain-containing protein n=1 Tax=Pseudenhygromyxa sp. WMMC2535 TaxID=2712867 RepID=UPI0015541E52|nr:DUF4157 domain-containing protein [Pseudenhygromyxa sp. WMMC2535]NVB39486.1 DUF4157 domain-containing protein [Pseudenhygromyxa sp. WMMC2535]
MFKLQSKNNIQTSRPKKPPKNAISRTGLRPFTSPSVEAARRGVSSLSSVGLADTKVLRGSDTAPQFEQLDASAFTYDDTIYLSHSASKDPHTIAHEMAHAAQQKLDPQPRIQRRKRSSNLYTNIQKVEDGKIDVQGDRLYHTIVRKRKGYRTISEVAKELNDIWKKAKKAGVSGSVEIDDVAKAIFMLNKDRLFASMTSDGPKFSMFYWESRLLLPLAMPKIGTTDAPKVDSQMIADLAGKFDPDMAPLLSARPSDRRTEEQLTQSAAYIMSRGNSSDPDDVEDSIENLASKLEAIDLRESEIDMFGNAKIAGMEYMLPFYRLQGKGAEELRADQDQIRLQSEQQKRALETLRASQTEPIVTALLKLANDPQTMFGVFSILWDQGLSRNDNVKKDVVLGFLTRISDADFLHLTSTPHGRDFIELIRSEVILKGHARLESYGKIGDSDKSVLLDRLKSCCDPIDRDKDENSCMGKVALNYDELFPMMASRIWNDASEVSTKRVNAEGSKRRVHKAGGLLLRDIIDVMEEMGIAREIGTSYFDKDHCYEHAEFHEDNPPDEDDPWAWKGTPAYPGNKDACNPWNGRFPKNCSSGPRWDPSPIDIIKNRLSGQKDGLYMFSMSINRWHTITVPTIKNGSKLEISWIDQLQDAPDAMAVNRAKHGWMEAKMWRFAQNRDTTRLTVRCSIPDSVVYQLYPTAELEAIVPGSLNWYKTKID